MAEAPGARTSIAALAGLKRAEDGDTDGLTEELNPLVDWNALQRLWSVEQWASNADSYARSVNNFQIYFEPGGRMSMNGWDVDDAFQRRRPNEDAIWERPGGMLARLCALDDTCRAQWSATALEVANELDTVDWVSRMDRLIELTREGADGDPRSGKPPEELEAKRDDLRERIASATDELRQAHVEFVSPGL